MNILPSRILVRLPNWIGDAVMATPVLELLRKKFQDAVIVVLGQPSILSLVAHNPHIDDVIVFSKKNVKTIIEEIKIKNFDLGILLTCSFSSAWQFFRANIPYRLGYKTHFRSLLLRPGVSFSLEYEKQHLVQTYQELLFPLGIEEKIVEPKIYVTAEEKNLASQLLATYGVSEKQHLIGINPGAAYGSAKCWLPDRFRSLTEKLIELPNVRVIYFGDKHSKPLVDDICKDLPVINLADKTSLRELIALISKCSQLITNDSGPMHIAAALKIPLVALFGSTSDVKTGPYKHGTVIHKHVSCSPCYQRTCPIDFRCMKSITVEEVQKIVEQEMYELV